MNPGASCLTHTRMSLFKIYVFYTWIALSVFLDISAFPNRSSSSHQRLRRLQARGRRECRYRGIYYYVGQQLSFRVDGKNFECTCLEGGRLDCTWTSILQRETARCFDSVLRVYKSEGEKWEKSINGKTYDCACKRTTLGMESHCSDESNDRCHQEGVSYRKGDVFQTTTISGLRMRCSCLGLKKLSCRHEATIPGPTADSQWVEDYIIYGGKVLRPQITTLQACRTGSKVVSSGVAWNQTSIDPFGVRKQEQCNCVDAIIKCKPLVVLDHVEPRCVSSDGRTRRLSEQWLKVRQHFPNQQLECTCIAHDDISCRRVRRPRCYDEEEGKIRIAGNTWVRHHVSFSNIRFQCTCQSNTEITCRDVGECITPSAPVNGALMCAKVGKHGPRQVMYCKPLCLANYEFVNSQRYYRIWEVCGPMNLHRWSGGFVDDPTAIAKCKVREGRRRGHPNLYLPTNDCQSMTYDQREELKDIFLRQLHYRELCRSKCEVVLTKCGSKS